MVVVDGIGRFVDDGDFLLFHAEQVDDVATGAVGDGDDVIGAFDRVFDLTVVAGAGFGQEVRIVHESQVVNGDDRFAAAWLPLGRMKSVLCRISSSRPDQINSRPRR